MNNSVDITSLLCLTGQSSCQISWANPTTSPEPLVFRAFCVSVRPYRSSRRFFYIFRYFLELAGIKSTPNRFVHHVLQFVDGYVLRHEAVAHDEDLFRVRLVVIALKRPSQMRNTHLIADFKRERLAFFSRFLHTGYSCVFLSTNQISI